jgi:HAD superfamily hydrolase (TIGR01509 family)
MIKAILFDMDGVLVDSEEFICQAAIAMFREKGLMVRPEDFIPFVGTGENRYIGGVAEKYNFTVDIQEVKKRTYAIYDTIVRNKLKPLPGVQEFIAACRKRGLKIAVATSADEIKMRINLREIGLPVETFDATVNGLQVERKKPFPDIYLMAAELLGVPRKNCLVVEDAPSGIKAARAAGMKCLAVMSSFSQRELHQAQWIVQDLTKVSVETLEC